MAPTEDRAALNRMKARVFDLVSKEAKSGQWAEWLRVPLEHAVAGGDKDLALSLLKAGANGGAGWKGYADRTMLEAAAEGGNEELVSTLLETGGLVELDYVTGADGKTALHRALAGGHTGVARVLMLAGANVALLDSRGRSSLHYAIEGGHLQLAENLIIGGAGLRVVDADGNSPLHLAAAHSDDKFVCTLLRRGGGRNVANEKGQCPLHVAVEHNRLSVAEALLKAGADPNVRYGEDNRFSPLRLSFSSLSMTKILLKYGADVKSSDMLGYTALHWASNLGLTAAGVIDALAEAGADLEARSSDVEMIVVSFKGLTPLHVASRSAKRSSVAALLRNGAMVNAKSDSGLTPLHILCKPNDFVTTAALSPRVADLLLRWGADETSTDHNGNTPEEMVEDSQYTSRLRQVLINAPVDRVWRRRGMLVMCRAFPDKIRVNGGIGRAARARARRGAGRGRRGSSVGRGRGVVDILAQVVEVEDDEIFRTIIEFV